MDICEEKTPRRVEEISLPAMSSRICLVGDVCNDSEAFAAVEQFGLPIVISETGLDFVDRGNWRTIYVLKHFEGPTYEALHKAKQCILGPPAVKYASEKGLALGLNTRPIYNYAMSEVVTCFTGIRKKDELTRLVNLIHSMGGCIKKDVNTKTTHLICNQIGGDKYQYAKTFRLSVVRPEWVYSAWEQRDKPDFRATSDAFSKDYKVRAFEGQKICFFGFPEEECKHMTEVLLENGGVPVELNDPECSHVVVDEHAANAHPEPKNQHTHILKSDWFWYTIQNGFANEMDYLFGDYLESIANTPNRTPHEPLPLSFSKRKRKRFSQRLQPEGTPVSAGKRRSSVSDAALLSGSFFDYTASPDTRGSQELLSESDVGSIDLPPNKRSMRFNHFMDFYTTESNYVGILDTILNLFKNKLEELADTSDSLLNKSEIKSIFGNFSPIHDVHRRMLDDLRNMQSNWMEDCLIGDIIIKFRNELIKAYPPYVNFYEQMREHLARCDKEYPRFHAFLKINQTKPECGRQSLQDLMIRPVQRLPSISLLLNDILKYTNASNPDHARLTEALKTIKEVTMHINEDKRRTESHKAFFAVFQDIDGIPQDFLSSNRSLISKIEVSELSDCLSGRGDVLYLYLFTDAIEVCKKSAGKKHKHVDLIPLNNIRFVIDITDSPRAFALLPRGKKEGKLYTLSIQDEETDKLSYLKKFCAQMAEHACRTDAEKILLYRTSQELEVDISDVNISTLSRAFRLAAKTRLKVGRAFSFNKTPNKLKRAVSTIMTSPFGSSNSLTPSSQLAQMRLASCHNIHEMDNNRLRSGSPSTHSDVVMMPIQEQPMHKTTMHVGRI